MPLVSMTTISGEDSLTMPLIEAIIGENIVLFIRKIQVDKNLQFWK